MPRLPIDVLLRPLSCLMLCASVTPAQEKPDSAKVLEKFFELGLPDAKRGKWVMCYVNSQQGGMPGGGRAEYSGNAWLLREAKGIVEVVMADGRFVRGRKLKDEDSEPGEDSPNPPVQIRPANLDEDLKVFSAELQTGNDERNSGNRESQAEEKAHAAGVSLLFLAQLQRQGRAEFVRDALPRVLATVPSPEMALDAAVSLLADGQLAALLRAWIEKGDAAAYAGGIDRLAATFPRGWKNREAALLLATRLREQKAAPHSGENDARHAADFLLKLSPAKFEELPVGRNWFISEAGARGDDSDEPNEADEPPRQPAKKDGVVAAFFAKKREVAIALARLLDDHRYLRCASRSDQTESYGTSWGEHQSREEVLRKQYDQIARPRELGEIAWAILSQLMPEDVRDLAREKPATRAASTLAWLKSVAAKSDEELAWDYLRNATSTYEDEFRGSLRFLVEKGGPETLAKLREVFLDPAVWSDNSVDDMIRQTEKYMKRAPADAAFADKLRAAVKASFDAEEAENRSNYSGSNAEEMKKQFAAQRSAHLKQLDRLFKPPQSVGEQLAEIVAMEETEALAALDAAGQSIAKKPVAEIESPIFHAAAQAKSAALKVQMLQLVMIAGTRGARGQPAARNDPPAVPGDAATRDAMLALLRDETLVANEWDPAATNTVKAYAAWALVWLHNDPARQSDWQRLSASVPHLAKKWVRTHALAMAGGQPVPPLPDASRLANGRAASLVAELGALPADQIPAALDGKTPDEQLGIVGHLQKAEEWPAPLVEAHFTIREVSGDKTADIGDPAWKGRRLDEKLVREIETACENAAAAGTYSSVAVSVSGPLGGVEISTSNSSRKLQVAQLTSGGVPGLTGKPAPGAMLFVSIGTQADPGASAGFWFPVWKDAASTRAWRDEHGKPKPGPEKKDARRRGFGFPVNPAPFEQKLRDSLAARQAARAPFQITLLACAIGKDDE